MDNKKSKIQISNAMLGSLIMQISWLSLIGVTQGIMQREMGGSGHWISSIFGAIFGGIFMWLVIILIQRMPTKNLAEHVQFLIGKWSSKFISLLFVIFFIGAFSVQNLVNYMHFEQYFLEDINCLLFNSAIIIACAISAYYGLEVICRISFFSLGLLFLIGISLFAGSIQWFDIEEFLPFMDEGFITTLFASRYYFSDISIIVLMCATILPMVKSPKKWPKLTMTSFTLANILIFIWPLLEIGVLSSRAMGNYTVCCMHMLRNAELSDLIQRFDFAMDIMGVFSASTQVIVVFLCLSYNTSNLLGTKKYRSVIIPVALILLGLNYWITADHLRTMTFLEDYWPLMSIPIVVTVPVLVWILGIIKKKKYRSLSKFQKT